MSLNRLMFTRLLIAAFLCRHTAQERLTVLRVVALGEGVSQA